MNEEFQPKKGNLLTTLCKVGKVYSVSFEFIMTESTGDWKNILHLTNSGDNDKYGARNPNIQLKPRGRLHITAAVNGEKSYAYSTKDPLLTNTWYKVEIEQKHEDDKV